jgi:hypothetical protein
MAGPCRAIKSYRVVNLNVLLEHDERVTSKEVRDVIGHELIEARLEQLGLDTLIHGHLDVVVQSGARVWVSTSLVVADKAVDPRVARLADSSLSATSHELRVNRLVSVCSSGSSGVHAGGREGSRGRLCGRSAIHRLFDDVPTSVLQDTTQRN